MEWALSLNAMRSDLKYIWQKNQEQIQALFFWIVSFFLLFFFEREFTKFFNFGNGHFCMYFIVRTISSSQKLLQCCEHEISILNEKNRVFEDLLWNSFPEDNWTHYNSSFGSTTTFQYFVFLMFTLVLLQYSYYYFNGVITSTLVQIISGNHAKSPIQMAKQKLFFFFDSNHWNFIFENSVTQCLYEWVCCSTFVYS